MTDHGLGDVLSHEGRRVKVAIIGYYATYDRVEIELSTKCGVVKKETLGEAKKLLEKYVRDLQIAAYDSYVSYRNRHNAFIDADNNPLNQRMAPPAPGYDIRRFNGYWSQYDVPD